MLYNIVIFTRNHSYLENLLHNVTMERPRIREGMIWCMEHAESSDEVVLINAHFQQIWCASYYYIQYLTGAT